MLKYIKQELSKIDAKATREAVEVELERALFYKITDIDRKEAKMISAYGDAVSESQRSNVTSDSTAQIATHNVSIEEERNAHIFRVERAISRLNKKQRELITRRYMVEYGVTDLDVYLDMNIGAPTYTKIRNEAVYMLAFILRVYVEIKEGDA